MKKIVSFLVALTFLITFASCGSDQKQEELKVEKPDVVNTVANTQEKPKKEQTTDYTKLFKSTINFEMEPIIKDEIPNKPQKLYFNQLGCEWIKNIDIKRVLDIEGQYAWFAQYSLPSGSFVGVKCVDLRNDKTVWNFERSDCSDYIFLDENNSNFDFCSQYREIDIVYDSSYFIFVLPYYGIGGEKTFFGLVDKYSGKLLWVKYEHQRIDDFKIMKDANRFIYRKMDGTEVFVALDISTGKELFSSKLDTKLFTIDFSPKYNTSSKWNISYFSANNHLILFASSQNKSKVSEGEGNDCVIHHIPTEKGQTYWKVSYIENADIYKSCMPRLLNDYIVVPNYNESKAYFLKYEDGSFINKNDVKLSIDINKALSIVELNDSLIIDNGINISRYNNKDFTNPEWIYEKDDSTTFIFNRIFNNNILLKKQNNKELSFICLDTDTGAKIWESSIATEIDYQPYISSIISRFIMRELDIKKFHYGTGIRYFDSFMLDGCNLIDLINGDKTIISNHYDLSNFDDKLFGEFYYCLSRYFVKFALPTENKVLIYPPQVYMSADNNLNKLDVKEIVLINTTAKPIDFTLEFSDIDTDDYENKFDKYISISSNKLTVKPFSKGYISVKEIKEIKSKNEYDGISFKKWLKIKFNNEERKIMIKAYDPRCDV